MYVIHTFRTPVQTLDNNARLPFTVTALAHGYGSIKGDLIPQDMLLNS